MTDAEAEAPMLWPPDMKNWLIGKNPDAGKDPDAGPRPDRGSYPSQDHTFQAHGCYLQNSNLQPDFFFL